MIILLLVWAMTTTVIAIVAIVDYSKYNHRFTRARKTLFDMAEKDNRNIAKLRHQRNVFHKYFKDFASQRFFRLSPLLEDLQIVLKEIEGEEI